MRVIAFNLERQEWSRLSVRGEETVSRARAKACDRGSLQHNTLDHSQNIGDDPSNTRPSFKKLLGENINAAVERWSLASIESTVAPTLQQQGGGGAELEVR